MIGTGQLMVILFDWSCWRRICFRRCWIGVHHRYIPTIVIIIEITMMIRAAAINLLSTTT